MGRAKRTNAPLRCVDRQARETANRGYFERFVLAHRRQPARQPLREHALTRAGWSDDKQRMRASRCDLQRALGTFLAAHIGQIGFNGIWSSRGRGTNDELTSLLAGGM